MAEAAKKSDKNAAPAPVAIAPPAPPKKDIVGFMLLALVTVNLLALSGMGYFLQKMWGQIHEVSEIAKKAVEMKESDQPREPKSLGKEIEPHKIGTLFPVDNMLVNINSDQGAKFLQVQMELELSDPAAESELKQKKAVLRDKVLVLLSSRSYKELREPEGMTKLRTDLARSINSILTVGEVKEVYFTQYHFN